MPETESQTKSPIDERADKLTELTAEMDKIIGTDEEPRVEPMTDEDRLKLDEMEAEADKLKSELDDLRGDEARQQRQAIRREALRTDSRGRRTLPAQPATEGHHIIPPQFRVPRRGRLRAFHGDTAHEDAYKSGMFLLATLGTGPQQQRAQQWCQEHGLGPDALAMSESNDTTGGVFVIEEFENAIIDLRETYGVFRRKAKVEQMASDTKVVPRRKSGLTAYYVGENTAATESEKGWDNVRLTARKLATLTRYSSELNEDAAISLADDLAAEAAYAFVKAEDDAGFLGDGTSTYGGISGLITECTTATATTVTAITANTAFSTLDLADFESMVGKLPEYAEPRANWYISRAGWGASMLRLLDAAGGNTRDQLEGKAQLLFLGYPVNIVQVMNSTLTAQTSTKGICYFGDLALAAKLGDRRGVTVKVSSDRYLEYDQIGILVTQRYDINVHDVGDTSAAGPMIMLATPAS